MTEQEIRQIVDQVLMQMGKSSAGALEVNPSDLQVSEDALPDISKEDLRRQYLVDNPHDQAAFLAMKERTPARVGVGHAGARYKTETMLRFQADHASAQASVFADVPQAFLDALALKVYKTSCKDRDEFLTRPDKGRVFDPEVLREIHAAIPRDTRVVVYVADGLSSAAVQANAADILPVIRKGLEAEGITTNDPFFVLYGRVATMEQIGEGLDAEVICVLLGERPGLVTAHSMSAYIAYRPKIGMVESGRTVLANIHSGGTPSVEAGAHIVDLIRRMLELKVSGIELPV